MLLWQSRYYNDDVQWGHLVASMCILLKQYVHFFVVTGAGSSFFLVKRLTCLTTKKMEKDIIRKSITLLINKP